MQQTLLAGLKPWTWYDFTQTNLSRVPHQSGVYCLGVNKEIIYIGSSNNLSGRLTDHYSSADPCISRAKQFAIEPCNNYSERERQRLQDYLAKHGRLPDCNDVIP